MIDIYVIYKNVVSPISATNPKMSPVIPPIFSSMDFFILKRTKLDNAVVMAKSLKIRSDGVNRTMPGKDSTK